MSEVQCNLTPSISIDGRPVCNLKFADDIDLLVGTNKELQGMTNNLSNVLADMASKSVQKK